MLSRFALVIIFTVFGNSLFISSAAARADTAPTILVFGDSLSAAYGIVREQGWVNLLQQRIKDKGLPYEVANASISGETTSGGLSRMQSALDQYKPDIVLLELGANDGLRGLPVADTQRNLAAMINASQAAKAKVVLIGIMIPPNYGPRYTHEFAEMYPTLAQRYHLPLVDFLLDGVAGKRELTLDDGLHPNASAQPRLLDNVWEVLQPELVSKRKVANK